MKKTTETTDNTRKEKIEKSKKMIQKYEKTLNRRKGIDEVFKKGMNSITYDAYANRGIVGHGITERLIRPLLKDKNTAGLIAQNISKYKHRITNTITITGVTTRGTATVAIIHDNGKKTIPEIINIYTELIKQGTELIGSNIRNHIKFQVKKRSPDADFKWVSEEDVLIKDMTITSTIRKA